MDRPVHELHMAPLADPKARAEALQLADELEDAAVRLERELQAELLVRAADIHRISLGDPSRALALLRRALHADAQSKSAIARLKELAEARGDYTELAEVLEHAAKVAPNDEQRAQLLAHRGDVLGKKLGRIVEARSLYREAARLTASTDLRDAALDAAKRIEAILGERRSSSPTSTLVDWQPVATQSVAIDDVKAVYVRRERSDSGSRSGRSPEVSRSRPDSNPSQATPLFRRAGVHLESNDKEQARQLIDAGLQIDPDNELGRQLLRRLLRSQGRHSELLDILVELSERSRKPVNAELALREAAQLAAGPLGDMDRAIALYQKCLSHEPVSEEALGEALSRGIGMGIIDIAQRVLPKMEPARRALLVTQLAQAAMMTGDDRASREFRAASFADAPQDATSFQAAVEVLRSSKDEEQLGRVLELRLEVIHDRVERRAIDFELAALRESQGKLREAAEALLDSIRLAHGDDDITDAILAIDRLSRHTRDRTLLARAHESAAERDGLLPKLKARHLRELARVLSEEIGDPERARITFAEAEAVHPASRGTSVAKDPARVRPKIGPSDEDVLEAPTSIAADWGQAVPPSKVETLVDREMSSQERRAVSRVYADGAESKGEWIVRPGAVDTVDGFQRIEPLSAEDSAPTPVGVHVDGLAVEDESGLLEDAPDLTSMEREPTDRSALPPDAVLAEARRTLHDEPSKTADFHESRTLEEPAPALEGERFVPDAPKTDSQSVVSELLRRGEIEDALDVLAASLASSEEAVPAGIWLETGRLALRLSRDDDAQVCLERALERVKDDPVLEDSIRRSLASSFTRAGAHREAAGALLPSVDRQGDEASADDLAEMGRLLLLSGEAEAAEPWLTDALAKDPKSIPAAEQQARIHVRRRDGAALSKLAQRMEAAQLEPRHASVWYRALGRARTYLGDVIGARDALLVALARNKSDLEPAETLFQLSVSARRDDWIDEALREIRARALEHQEVSRAFLAAAVLVARASALEDDRLTYESLRVALRSRPRAPLGREWIHAWLGEATLSSPDEDAIFGQPLPIDPAIAEAIEVAETALGLTKVGVHRLESKRSKSAARAEPSPAIALSADLLRDHLTKDLRFFVARAIAALSDPRLASALAVEEAAPAVIALDRAGLVLSGDPKVALDIVGARSPRGEALAAFAVSRELPALWARYGLGIVPRASDSERSRVPLSAEG
jgi:tetratricopeptide (TPR) repeat protein